MVHDGQADVETMDVTEGLEVLRPALSEWIRITRASLSPDRHPPRWCSEATFVGQLAMAVYRQGGVAYQELRVTRNQSAGFLDLWFNIGGTNFLIEAKYCELEHLNENDPLIVAEAIERSFTEAIAQVSGVLLPGAVTKLAVVFASRYTWTKHLREAADMKRGFIDAVRRVPAGARAWATTEEGIELGLGDDWWQLGTALLARVA
jgi:hypothetical protein